MPIPQPKEFKAPKYRNIVRRSQRPKVAPPKAPKAEEPTPSDWRERRAALLAKHAKEVTGGFGYRTPLETGD